MVLPRVPGISDSVFEVTRKATAIKQEDRYQNASAMKQALKEALPPRNYSKFDRFLSGILKK
jgi:hypothetical protein